MLNPVLLLVKPLCTTSGQLRTFKVLAPSPLLGFMSSSPNVD